MPRSGIVGSYGSSNLVFWRTSILISIVAALIYIPTNIFSPALSSLQDLASTWTSKVGMFI
jgi:hypothetical protein